MFQYYFFDGGESSDFVVFVSLFFQIIIFNPKNQWMILLPIVQQMLMNSAYSEVPDLTPQEEQGIKRISLPIAWSKLLHRDKCMWQGE